MPISATCPNTSCAELLEIDDLDAGAFEGILKVCGQGYWQEKVLPRFAEEFK